jgi:hypothetical protein
MLEASFKKWLVKALRDFGAFVQTIETTTGRGVPDLVVLLSGRTIWMEVKCVSGSVSIRAEQLIWHTKARKSGVEVITINYNEKTQYIELYDIDNKVKMSKGWKLTHRFAKFKKEDLAIGINYYVRPHQNRTRKH